MSLESDPAQIIASLQEQLEATEALLRIFKKQNQRMARVNVALIRELHAFAMRYGGE